MIVIAAHTPRRRLRAGGFTLIEIMVVISIIGLAMGGAVYSFRAVTRTELRGSATKLAAAIRYCFDRSVTTGAYYRIVLDLENNKYWAERSDDRVYLTQGKEASPGGGKALDVEEIERRQREIAAEQDKALQSRGPLAALLEPAPRLKRPKFQTFKDSTLPQVNLKKIRIFDVFTARQREPYTQGKAYLYFFPDGHTERAYIRLNEGDNFYTLVLSPLTGRVEVKEGKIDPPREFQDAEGREVVR